MRLHAKYIIISLLVLLNLTLIGQATAEELSLDGSWQFSTDPDLESSWKEVTVPGNWNTIPDFSTFSGKGYYRRKFNVPSQWRGKHLRINFGAVYHEASVEINGKLIGTHVGGYTPFDFDITNAIQFDQPNTLKVCADNSYHRGAWWAWGGISRSVKLVSDNDARIIWQHIRPELDLKTGSAELFLEYRLANHTDTPLHASVETSIEKTNAKSTNTFLIPANSESTYTSKLNLRPEEVKRWDFDHPNLYSVQSTLSFLGKSLDQKVDRIGIRKIEVTKDSLLLNGEPVRLCGFNRVSDSNEFGNTEPDDLVKKDLDLMKQAGSNLTRIMHYPQAINLLDYLDEKGMLIFCEIPVWGGDDPRKNPNDLLARQWLSEMIQRDYNHPCIIGWSVGNEMTDHYEYVKSMIDYVRNELDSHRLLTNVSLSGARNDYGPQNDPITVSDILLHNVYSDSPGKMAETLRRKWPDKPIFFTEFGSRQFGAGLDKTIPGLEQRWNDLKNHPYVIGVSLWTFNDYRSSYKGTPASGNREWGVVTVDRKPKAAYEQIRKLFGPVKSISFKDGIVTIDPRAIDEIPSYVLRDYKLRWTGGEVNVPEIKPGDQSVQIKVSAPPEIKIELVTPTGYSVADSKQADPFASGK